MEYIVRLFVLVLLRGELSGSLQKLRRHFREIQRIPIRGGIVHLAGFLQIQIRIFYQRSQEIEGLFQVREDGHILIIQTGLHFLVQMVAFIVAVFPADAQKSKIPGYSQAGYHGRPVIVGLL